MEIVKLKKEEDLEMVKSLVDYKEYFESDNIMWDRSVKCITNNGDLLGFALIKPNSLFDFFGGEIPPEIGVPEDEKWWVKEDLECFKDDHYEVLYYLKEIDANYKKIVNTNSLFVLYEMNSELKTDKDENPIGIMWTKTIPFEYTGGYFLFNNIVYLNIPIID